jgi:hypothetical protein
MDRPSHEYDHHKDREKDVKDLIDFLEDSRKKVLGLIKVIPMDVPKRTEKITQDDLTDLKIDLGLCEDVCDFIRRM